MRQLTDMAISVPYLLNYNSVERNWDAASNLRSKHKIDSVFLYKRRKSQEKITGARWPLKRNLHGREVIGRGCSSCRVTHVIMYYYKDVALSGIHLQFRSSIFMSRFGLLIV